MNHIRYQSTFPIILSVLLFIIGINSGEPVFVIIAVPIALYTIYRWMLFKEKMKAQLETDKIDNIRSDEESQVDTYLSNAEKIILLTKLKDTKEITEEEFKIQKAKILALSTENTITEKKIKAMGLNE